MAASHLWLPSWELSFLELAWRRFRDRSFFLAASGCLSPCLDRYGSRSGPGAGHRVIESVTFHLFLVRREWKAFMGTIPQPETRTGQPPGQRKGKNYEWTQNERW